MCDTNVLKLILSSSNIKADTLILDQARQILATQHDPESSIQHLKVLSSLLEISCDHMTDEVANKICQDLCLPFLFKSSENVAIPTSNVIVDIVSSISKLSFGRLSGVNRELLQMLCLQSLEAASDDVNLSTRKILHIKYAVQLTGSLLSVSTDVTWKDLVFKQILANIKNSDDIVLNQILRVIFPAIFSKDQSTLTNQLELLWDLISSIGYNVSGNQGDHRDQSNKCFLLLCSFADQFFPLHSSKHYTQLVAQDQFWSLLQTGFYNRDPLTRKRTLYLLKRILEITEKNQVAICGKRKNSEHGSPLFWWKVEDSKELSNTWDDYILLVETLEEKQVHVIKPLLPRVTNLENATMDNRKGPPLLHTSWLLAIYRRLAIHESTYLLRWGVERFLNTDFAVCPMFQQNQHQFLHGELVKILTETSLFNKPAELLIGSSSPIGVAMQHFFMNCHRQLTSVEAKADFFTQFLLEMSRHHWGGSALVYISQALTFVPKSQLLDQQALFSIRDLLTKSLRTLEVHLRGAVQCFLLRAVLNLADKSKVEPCQIFSIISLLKSDESFRRGTQSWQEVVDWLKREILPNTANQNWSPLMLREYLEISLSNILKSSDDYDSKENRQMAQALVLCADADVIKKRDGESELPLVSLIAPVITVINSMNTRAYMSSRKADTAIFILLMMAQDAEDFNSVSENEEDNLSVTIRSLISTCSSDILLYLKRRTTQLMLNLADLSSIPLYTETTQILSRWLKPGDVLSYFRPLVMECFQTFIDSVPKALSEERQIRRLVCLSMMASVCGTLFNYKTQHKRELPAWIDQLAEHVRRMEIIHVFEKPEIKGTQEKSGNVAERSVQWGQVASDYITAQWTCVHWSLSHCPAELTGPDTALIDHCMEALNVCGSDAVPHIFGCFRLLLTKESLSAEAIGNIFDITWRKTFEETKAACFWDIFEGFVSMVFQPIFLREGEGTVIYSHLHLYADKIFDVGEEKNGVVNVLVCHLCQGWSDAGNFKHALRYSNIVVNAIMFGNVHLKGMRHSSDTSAYVSTLGRDCAANTLVQSNLRDDNLVRVHIISLLANLKREDPLHIEFVKMVFNSLKTKIKSLNSQRGYRNFTNSFNHRQKHRIMTAMLVMEPLLQTEDTVEDIMSFALAYLETESQPSVRCQLEWLILRLIHRRPTFADRIWKKISHTSEKKSSYVCSLFNLMIHIGPLLRDASKQESFYMQAIHSILPWCMAHHFNTRVFAEATLITLWQQCKDAKFISIIEKFSIVDAIISYQENNSNALKSTKKLLENFFFTFDPMRDYNIETIFSTLPRLTSITDEEWLPGQLFCQVDKNWSHDQPLRIPLRSDNATLSHCSPGNWRMKAPGVEGDNSDPSEGDVQKKMMPWRCMLPEADLSVAEEYTKKQQRQVGQLVLVTSLVDKIPNLGGLCRTSEIFGVAEFIVGNIKNVEDKNFQSLSVTAHKWIPIKEVRPWFLKEYLLEMRDRGYALVGVEQTANSRDLTDYTFPEKTLLLLGNEKEGLPVELIQFLDVCVEIPQQGFVRSLNVHVSGALLIWEYTRQQLLKRPPGGTS